MTDETINENIVISDFLSFLTHKWKNWPLKELLNILQDFYSISDANNALKTLIKSLPNKKYYLTVLDKFDETNIFNLIILFMDFIAEDDMPIFVCKDLCNIPSFSTNFAMKIKLIDKLSSNETKTTLTNDQLYGDLDKWTELNSNTPVSTLSFGKATSLKRRKLNNLRMTKKKKCMSKFQNPKRPYEVISLVDDEGPVTNTTNEDKIAVPYRPTCSNKFDESHLEAVKDSSLIPYEDNAVLKYKFATKMKLKSHSKLDTFGIVDHRCPLCFARLKEKDWLSHVHNCPGDGTIYKKDICCHICNIFYADPSILKYHMSFHDESREYVCLKCNFRFCTKKALDSHSKSYIITGRSVKCPFCPKYSDSSNSDEHIRSHTGDRPFKCHVCDLYTTSATRLNRHALTHKTVKKKRYTCEDCGNIYQSYEKISVHIKKAHRTNNPLKCGGCGEGFKTGKELSKHHEEEHMGLKDSFPCPYGNCNFVAKTGGDLGAHINVHTKSRPFKCNLCDYGANHKSYLTWHIRCHHSQVLP